MFLPVPFDIIILALYLTSGCSFKHFYLEDASDFILSYHVLIYNRYLILFSHFHTNCSF